MNLQEARQNLPLYADGELDPQATAELEGHLAESAELRDELERWRSLRRCANRVFAAPIAPNELEARIRAGLHRERLAARHRPFRWFGGITAVAAAIAVIVVLWPRSSVPDHPKLVSADRFVETYLNCAVKNRHRGVDIDLQDLAATRARLAGLTTYPVLVPDLRDAGFELDGACRCFKEPGVQAVHVFYRRGGPVPAVVSFFSVDQTVHLAGCQCERCTGPGGMDREYEVAQAEGVVVYKWDETANSFAVCSEMETAQLRDLANRVQLASRQEYPALFARAD